MDGVLPEEGMGDGRGRVRQVGPIKDEAASSRVRRTTNEMMIADGCDTLLGFAVSFGQPPGVTSWS